MTTLSPEQQARLGGFTRLGKGAGTHGVKDACVMQAVDYVFRNEDHFTDHPSCSSPVLTAYAIALNDSIPDDETRTALLLPVIPLLVGTYTDDPTIEQRRAFKLSDVAIRVFAPDVLESAASALKTFPGQAKALIEQAATLKALPEITDASAARSAADSARSAARSADSAARNRIYGLAAKTLAEACLIGSS